MKSILNKRHFSHEQRQILSLSLKSVALIFLSNFLFWPYYQTMPFQTVLAYIFVFILIYFITSKYIKKEISSYFFIPSSFMIFVIKMLIIGALEFAVSYVAFTNSQLEIEYGNQNNQLNIEVSNKDQVLTQLANQHNQQVMELNNLDILALCSKQSTHHQSKAQAELDTLKMMLTELQANQAPETVSAIQYEAKSRCTKAVIQQKLAHINQIRTKFTEASDEKRQLENQAQALVQNKQGFFANADGMNSFKAFYDEFAKVIFVSMFLNAVFNKLLLNSAFKQALLLHSMNLMVLPRQRILECLLKYQLVETTDVVLKWWNKWFSSNGQRYRYLKNKRIVCLDKNHPEDNEMMAIFHTNASVLTATIVDESEVQKLKNLGLLPHHFDYQTHILYQFKRSDFDFYFSYNNCLK